MQDIIYNVTVKIEHSVHQQWLDWMRAIHIADVLETGCFTAARIARLLSHQDEDGVTYAIQYICQDNADLQRYQDQYAAALQEDHRQKFKGKYVAFRTLLQVVDTFVVD